MTEIAIPSTGTASVHVLYEGYVGLAGDGERVSGIFSHHHPDHTVNAALFRSARIGTDATALKAGRDLLRGLAPVVIPGHGGPFRPGEHA